MSRGKKHTAEPIISKLREAEVAISQGSDCSHCCQVNWSDRLDVFSLA